MYLTRMFLNPRRRQTLRFKSDPQALHAAIESAFPPSDAQERNLWRLDTGTNELALLILSHRRPSLEHLQEQAGWEAERTWETKAYDPLLHRIKVGQRYAFRLTANPTRIVTSPSGVKRRKAHVSAHHQMEWLFKKEEEMGVKLFPGGEKDEERGKEIPWAPIITERFTQRFRRGSNQVTIVKATFSGVLEVTSADDLRRALIEGVGPAKAYGCGLLTLAPVG